MQPLFSFEPHPFVSQALWTLAFHRVDVSALARPTDPVGSRYSGTNCCGTPNT